MAEQITEYATHRAAVIGQVRLLERSPGRGADLAAPAAQWDRGDGR